MENVLMYEEWLKDSSDQFLFEQSENLVKKEFI